MFNGCVGIQTNSDCRNMGLFGSPTSYKGQKYSEVRKKALDSGHPHIDTSFPPDNKSVFSSTRAMTGIAWMRPKVRCVFANGFMWWLYQPRCYRFRLPCDPLQFQCLTYFHVACFCRRIFMKTLSFMMLTKHAFDSVRVIVANHGWFQPAVHCITIQTSGIR